MGFFSKPQQPKKKRGLFDGFSNRSETKHRIAWGQDRNGMAAETIKNYKKKRGGFNSADAEDVRRELAKQDSYFRYTDTKDVEDALRD
jgi:hypothetical protein